MSSKDKYVSNVIRKRHSVRAFTQELVPDTVIKEILEIARFAPSGVNSQPWQVAVVKGDTKKTLETNILESFNTGSRGKMDYDYYPASWQSPYKERRAETGKILYETLGIPYEDKAKRLKQWAKNYTAFDAPVVLFFFMDKCMGTGSFLDYGMFLNNIMLLAIENGLATCPQGALGEYPDTVKELLGYPMDCILIGGMALGYEDKKAKVNSVKTTRIPLENFARYFH